MATPKKLPKARKRYFIEQPVVVMPLAEIERLYEHMISMGLYGNQPKNIKVGLDQRQQLLLRELKAKIKGAKSHYNIKDGARLSSRADIEETLNEEADALLSR